MVFEREREREKEIRRRECVGDRIVKREREWVNKR
jgi:hypothetical protein